MIRGVFVTRTVSKVGTGHTAKRVVQVCRCYVEESPDGSILSRPVGNDHLPFGKPTRVDREEFLNGYSPDLHYYMHKVYPAIVSRDAKKEAHLARGDQARGECRWYSAEFEYAEALSVDEDSVRANYGIGMTYLAQGRSDKAKAVFDQVMTLDSAFNARHKHLFNDFGIGLRKSGLHDLAVGFYERAAALCPDDENIRFNMARAYCCMGCMDEAMECVGQCLGMSPGHAQAVKLSEFIGFKQGKTLTA